MRNRYLSLLSSILYDIVASVLSIFISFKIVGQPITYSPINIFAFSFFAWPALIILCFYIFKIYYVLWRFSRFADLLKVSVSTIFSISALFISQMAVYSKHFDFEIFIIMLFILNCLILLHRLFFERIIAKIINLQGYDKNNSPISGNIMLIGAGSAGSSIINEISDNKQCGLCKIKCVIDDNPAKKGQYISGVRIVGDRNYIIEAAEKYDISMIIFAIPSCTNKQKSEILNICQQTNCELKIVPSIYQILNQPVISKTIRNVEIEDLLGREPIDINISGIMNYVTDKVVLVTGGGGTIGSELCRQIASYCPKKLIILDIYENNAYDIQNELKHNYPDLQLDALIGSVRDTKRLDNIFKKYKPDIVYHAAAHKHVPLMEESPNETIKNNVFGTFKTAKCADKYGAEKFILISTDKAVNPTNIMGASKRICEMIVQTYNKRSDTDFVAVRFGNVLGSNGSVIPLFKKQIEHGGPVTVTDSNIIRYFMTIPEAVSLVLQAGATAKGGEIFVLDMGKPVKILTLAENLIRLSGLTPYKDISIQFIGLRPGEKLYEELLMAEEGLKETENKLIYIGRPIDIDEELLFSTLDEMQTKMYDDSIDIRALVKRIVPTYNYYSKEQTFSFETEDQIK